VSLSGIIDAIWLRHTRRCPTMGHRLLQEQASTSILFKPLNGASRWIPNLISPSEPQISRFVDFKCWRFVHQRHLPSYQWFHQRVWPVIHKEGSVCAKHVTKDNIDVSIGYNSHKFPLSSLMVIYIIRSRWSATIKWRIPAQTFEKYLPCFNALTPLP